MFYSVEINHAEYLTIYVKDHEELVEAWQALIEMHTRAGGKIEMSEYDAVRNEFKFMVNTGDSDYMVSIQPYEKKAIDNIVSEILTIPQGGVIY